MTPRAKKVIEHAFNEGRRLNHNYVGTEHLLLGLLNVEEGVAAQVLMNLGLTLEAVRQEIVNLIGSSMAVGEGTRQEQPNIPRHLNRSFMYLPDELVQYLEEISEHLDKLNMEKEQAVAEQDFQKAAMLRDREAKTKERLTELIDTVKQIRASIRESEGESH